MTLQLYNKRPFSLVLLSLAQGIVLGTALIMLSQHSAIAASGVTINGVVPQPDYSSSSQGYPYSSGPVGSRATVNGRSIKEMGGKTYSSTPAQGPVILRDLGALPLPVWRMAKAIFEASQEDSLDALRMPIEMNEMPPSFGAAAASSRDPVAQLRSLSQSGEDEEILNALFDTLTSGFVHVGRGSPYEAYVWPYFAHYPISSLDTAQREELRQLLPPDAYQQTIQSGQYAYYILGISPDGVWQYFFKEQ
ncbi:hypothetical protein SAMN04488056_104168 [Cohaesibacter marisflavi]|uniref:Uncharacterized protein n=1 Tax=Cohaesibacter marisflavi TaxID=655353 RepID=A0A1I5FQZ4_9HYPH|nr:hypothetical protein [Cohaesibacter marisflavi]SFO26184.1 hypothetical protein SAMN04488056_104168 [Cohaesibacter marisflavi]